MYEGDWCNGVPQFGDWVITYPSASVYLGSAEFLDQVNPPVPMGFGSQKEPDSTFFTGHFLNVQRHGDGLLLLANGLTYEGKWEHGILLKTSKSPVSSIPKGIGSHEKLPASCA